MNFSQFLTILLVRKWIVLGVVAGAVLVAVGVNVLLPHRYTATTTVILDVTRPDPIEGLLTSGRVPLGSPSPGYLATQVKIIQSHNVALKVVDSLGLANNPATERRFVQATHGIGDIRDWLAGALTQYLSAKPDQRDGSSIISISFEGENPRFAAVMANAFADAYIQTNLDLRVEPARQTTAWFDEQLKVLREKWEQAQAKLSDYQQKHGIVAVDEKLDVENARLADISSQLVTLQSQASESQSREKRLQDTIRRGGSLNGLPDVINNAVVQNLQEDLARSEVKLEELGRHLEKNHPDYQKQLAEVQGLKKRVNEEIRVAVNGIRNNAAISRQREAELLDDLVAQKTKVLELKQQRNEVDMLNRDVDNAQHVYDAALSRFSQSRLEGNATETDATVLDTAVPPLRPASPRVLLNLLVALMLGTMLGVGTAFAVESRAPRVRSGENLIDTLGVPFLGTFHFTSGQRRRWWPLFPRNNLRLPSGHRVLIHRAT